MNNDQNHCFYCARKLYSHGSPEVLNDPWCKRTRDHYVPAFTGSDALKPENIIYACAGCNTIKGSHPASIFIKFMAEWKGSRDVGTKRLELSRVVYELAQFGLIAASERLKFLERQKPPISFEHRDNRGRFTKRDLRAALSPEPHQ